MLRFSGRSPQRWADDKDSARREPTENSLQDEKRLGNVQMKGAQRKIYAFATDKNALEQNKRRKLHRPALQTGMLSKIFNEITTRKIAFQFRKPKIGICCCLALCPPTFREFFKYIRNFRRRWTTQNGHTHIHHTKDFQIPTWFQSKNPKLKVEINFSNFREILISFGDR